MGPHRLKISAAGISTADPREHYLASLIVSFLSSNLGIRDNDGFVSGQSVVTEMKRHSFVEEQIQHALRRLSAKRLIETPHSHYRELKVPELEPPEQFYFRATSVGVYHVRFWTGAFGFLEATSTDTPIFDVTFREEISKFAASFDIKDRLYKADNFRKYLEGQWFLANIGADYYDFPGLIQAQNYGFDAVRRFVDKGPRRRRH